MLSTVWHSKLYKRNNQYSAYFWRKIWETHMTLLENDLRSHIFKCKMIQGYIYLKCFPESSEKGEVILSVRTESQIVRTCIFSILFPRVWIIFTIITLNSFSGRLVISPSLVWSGGFLPCSFICCVFLCLLILLNLLCLGSPFRSLQVHSSCCFWCLPPVGKVGSETFNKDLEEQKRKQTMMNNAINEI